MSRLAKTIVLSLSALILSFVTLGFVLGQTTDDKTYRSLSVFGEVLQRIQTDWVEDPDMRVVTSGALHGLLESLDPYSSYLSPAEYAEYKKRAANGAKGKVGLALSKRFGYIVVLSALPDSPAQKAGVRSGDLLEAIAGFTTREMSIGQAEMLLSGDPGTSVKASVIHRGRNEAQETEMVRAELASQKLLSERLEDDIAYIGVPALDAGKAQEIRRRLGELERQGARKLILDLRDCASGDITEGIEVARLFVASGTLATLQGQTFPAKQFAAEPAKVAWTHPLTVLISGTTSGAAEVLAAAIGGNRRGDIVGERSFGSASEQKLIPLEDGAALILTVANYYTPAGKSIPDEGVTPTVEVDGPGDDLTPDTSGHPPHPNSLRDDPVIKKAIEILSKPASTGAAEGGGAEGHVPSAPEGTPNRSSLQAVDPALGRPA